MVKLPENPSWVFHNTDGGEMGNKIIFLSISYIIFLLDARLFHINPSRCKKYTPGLNFEKIAS